MVTKMCYGKLFVHEVFGPSALTHAISLHKETDKKWSRLEQPCKFPEQTNCYCHTYFEGATNPHHISVSFPKKNPDEENQVWGIEWSAAPNKFYRFITTVPYGIIPKNEQGLCENLLKYLHKKWGDICSCEDKQLEDIVSCYVYPLFWPRTGLKILPILPPQLAKGTVQKEG